MHTHQYLENMSIFLECLNVEAVTVWWPIRPATHISGTVTERFKVMGEEQNIPQYHAAEPQSQCPLLQVCGLMALELYYL
jgi:hypothetical protein